MEELELRMYFFVPYNISEIQKSIQAGHAALEYAYDYGNTPLFKEFVEKHKTWIILNGGTTNNNPENNAGLQTLLECIKTHNLTHTGTRPPLRYATFHEPDLNDALTAICFICDQRVWDYENYPDIDEDDLYDGTKNLDDIAEVNENWKKTMGGDTNIFLRTLIKGMRLA